MAVKKLWASHHQAISSYYKVCRQAPIATLMTMMVIAVVLILPMLLWIFTQAMTHGTNPWDNHQTIALYLKHELKPKQIQTVLERVQQLDGVRQATLILPEQGLLELQQDVNLRESLLYLHENPLPAMIEVSLHMSLNTPEQIQELFSQLSLEPEVDLAQLDLQWVNQLHGVMQFVHTLIYALMGLLAFAVVIIIGNTLRLVVHKQHEELQVLKLIGASEAFIMRPFLYAGLGFGLGGALLALGLMQMFFWLLDDALQQLFLAYQLPYTGFHFNVTQVGGLFALALSLGWLAAKLSVKRQLTLIEPMR